MTVGSRDVRQRHASSVNEGDATQNDDTDLHDRSPWCDDAPFTAWSIGCGLIGGSIARALRRRWPSVTLVGIDTPTVGQRALDAGVVDEAMDRAAWIRELARRPPDLVVLAAPVDAVLATLDALAPVSQTLEQRAPLIVDVGSIKVPIVRRAERARCPRFIGGHPMAGKAEGGLSAARDDLFDERVFALCPTDTTDPRDLAAARALVRGLGATPLTCSAREHDRSVAMVSHLPHLLAWSLMDALARHAASLEHQSLPSDLAAGSWRDATRVATADPAVWSAIFDHGRESVGEALDCLLEVLQRVRSGLAEPGVDILAAGPQGLDAASSGRARREQAAKLPPASA